MARLLHFIFGTRPESLKIWPLAREAKRLKVPFRTVCTGQHTDLLIGTKLKADVNLGISGIDDPLEYVEKARQGVCQYLNSARKVSTVIVQGDTGSALAGAKAAKDLGYPVAHVEAGLRSHDLTDPWPEEGFRVQIDQIAAHHFCPTEGNIANLSAELPGKSFYLSGNTIVDALRLMRVSRGIPKNYVLVTLHRRESFGEPLLNILKGLRNFASDHPDTAVLWPMHPNPHVREALEHVHMPTNVLMRGPLPYEGFLEILASANCVLTDSGGVVEEATTLGVPIVCARRSTERPEAFDLPHNRLVGTTTLAVEGALRLAYWETGTPSTTFGDGDASQQIMNVLC